MDGAMRQVVVASMVGLALWPGWKEETMGKNLYKATVTMEVEVLITADEAPDDADILEAAHEEIRENWSAFHPTNCGWVSTPTHITELRQLPKGWRNAIPYGDDPQDRTCLQILDAYVPKRPPLGEQQGLLGAAEQQDA